jgi:alpha-1,3-glucan synthase
MRLISAALSLLSVASLVQASPYRDDLVDYNTNTNQNAQSPTDYSATKRSSYFPSPDNWREIPFYTLLLDKFADGDPSNNDYFGTVYEWDWRETQLRFGGDLKGLVSKLDYLQGMGIKGIFISGTPFLNMLWQADSERLSSCFVNLCPKACRRLLAPRLHGSGPSLGYVGRLASNHR